MTTLTEVSEVPLPEGHTRCIEITRGFERSCPESGDYTMGRIISFMGALLVGYLVIWIVITNLSRDLEGLIASGIVWLLVIVGFSLFMQVISGRDILMGILNRLYYKVDSLVESHLVENEVVLVTLCIARSASPRNKAKRNRRGLFVLTTHRCFLLSTSSETQELHKAILRKNLVSIEVCDYSSAANLLPPTDTTHFLWRWYARRISVKPYGSGKFEKWHIMPTDGNNYRLLEAILARRDRIE